MHDGGKEVGAAELPDQRITRLSMILEFSAELSGSSLYGLVGLEAARTAQLLRACVLKVPAEHRWEICPFQQRVKVEATGYRNLKLNRFIMRSSGTCCLFVHEGLRGASKGWKTISTCCAFVLHKVCLMEMWTVCCGSFGTCSATQVLLLVQALRDLPQVLRAFACRSWSFEFGNGRAP